MRFQAMQMSMVISWIQATGTITPDTPKIFEGFLKDNSRWLPSTVFLHSPGGDLLAGLTLGEMIRRARLNTTIGHTIDLEGAMNTYTYPDAYCLSACAYAFLGGASRSYSENQVYGIHRFGVQDGEISGDQAQVMSGIVAKYIEEMGVDLSVFELASSARFQDQIYRVPLSVAKETRIIYDPTGVSTFAIEYNNGRTIARFGVEVRQRHIDGTISCLSGAPVLMIQDQTNGIPPALSVADDFPAEFKSPRGMLLAYASYIKSDTKHSSAMVFRVPGLQPADFLGVGLSLSTIYNPGLAPIDTNAPMKADQFVSRLRWFDAADALWFSISAKNADETLPIILNECGR
jgi:hypothetical protein